jgi:hypothetical protein
MDKARKPWFRGAVSIAVLVGVAAALIASPAISLTSQEKKQVKKIAKKQIKKAAPGLEVGTAENLANVTYIKGPATTVPADTQTHLLAGAICPAGTNVVGGGLLGSFFFRVAQSYPTAANGSDPGRQGWTVRVENTFGGGGAADGQAVAICVGADATSGTWP